MTEDEARAALGAARVARLATADAAGRPHVVPICLAVEGGRIFTAIDHKPKRDVELKRLANVRANPRVAVLADRYDDTDWAALWWARADGRARIVEVGDDEHRLGADLLSTRYAQYAEHPPQRELIVVDIERVSGWGRIPDPLRSDRAPAISHIDLVVSSLERSLAFYRGLLEPLGWTRLRQVRGERGETIHYLGIPGRSGAIGLRQSQSDAHPTPYDRYGVGVHHVCFDVADRATVDDRWHWARREGATIESEPREYDYTSGYYALFLHDPDGIKLEILHRPPA